MFVIAQLSTSVSDDQIRLIIVALLVVAVLLALLTTWYAVKTSPRRRVRVAQARRGAADARSAPPVRNTPAATPSRPPDEERSRHTAGHGEPPDGLPDDDEWTRLTAPQQQRSPNG